MPSSRHKELLGQEKAARARCPALGQEDLLELVVSECEASKNFIAGAYYTALVSRRVLEDDNTLILKELTSLLSEIEVGTLKNSEGSWLAVLVKVVSDVQSVESTRTTTTRYKDISIVLVCIHTEDLLGSVAGNPVLNNFAVLLLDEEGLLLEGALLACLP